jgi:hypothetical protein
MSYVLRTFGDAERFTIQIDPDTGIPLDVEDQTIVAGAVTEEEYKQAEKLVSEILNMRGEIISKSQAISKMVDAARPGIASGVDWSKIFTGGGGEAARQWFALRDRANSLYEEAKSLFDEWDSIFDEKVWDFKVAGIDMARLQGYHRRFTEILSKHRQFLGETTDIVREGSEKVAESKTPETGIGTGISKTISQVGGSIILYGGVALLLFTVVVPALRKKYS